MEEAKGKTGLVPEGRVKMILDTDGGVDDLLAVLLALASPRIDVLAITVVSGNVPTKQATDNIILLLRFLEKCTEEFETSNDRPLFAVPPIVAADGEDGVGGITKLKDEIKGQLLYGTDPRSHKSTALHDKGGVEVMLELLRSHGEKEITIVTIGPLTNVALAAAIDVEAVKRVKEIVIMGGAFDMPGNITPHAEYNLFVDPESVDVVLRLGVPLVFVPLNVTHQVKLARAEALIPFVEEYPIVQFVDHLTVNAMKHNIGDYIHMHDPLAVAVAMDTEQKFSKRMKRMVKVDCSDECAGKSFALECTTDKQTRQAEDQGYAPAFVCLEVDPPAVLRLWADQVLKAYHRPKTNATAS